MQGKSQIEMRDRSSNHGRGEYSDVTRVNDSNVLVGTAKNNENNASKFKSNALI